MISKLITTGCLLCVLVVTSACSNYGDYATAYSNHQLNDRERITNSQNKIRDTYADVVGKLYSSSPYLVEMTVYDAKGNPMPLKIKDTSRDAYAMFLTMSMSRDMADVAKPTEFNLKAPTTIEDVAMRLVDYTPLFAMWGAMATMADKIGDSLNVTNDNGGVLNYGDGTLNNNPVDAVNSFNPLTNN